MLNVLTGFRWGVGGTESEDLVATTKHAQKDTGINGTPTVLVHTFNVVSPLDIGPSIPKITVFCSFIANI